MKQSGSCDADKRVSFLKEKEKTLRRESVKRKRGGRVYLRPVDGGEDGEEGRGVGGGGGGEVEGRGVVEGEGRVEA